MGFLDFLFKPKEELPENKPLFEEETISIKVKPLSDKGVTQIKSGKWRAFVNVPTKKDNKVKYTQLHVGYFNTKEEAQEARYEYIEKLK